MGKITDLISRVRCMKEDLLRLPHLPNQSILSLSTTSDMKIKPLEKKGSTGTSSAIGFGTGGRGSDGIQFEGRQINGSERGRINDKRAEISESNVFLLK
jgi:hypothetical protein